MEHLDSFLLAVFCPFDMMGLPCISCQMKSWFLFSAEPCFQAPEGGREPFVQRIFPVPPILFRKRNNFFPASAGASAAVTTADGFAG